jgi:hypothetical protein
MRSWRKKIGPRAAVVVIRKAHSAASGQERQRDHAARHVERAFPNRKRFMADRRSVGMHDVSGFSLKKPKERRPLFSERESCTAGSGRRLTLQ